MIHTRTKILKQDIINVNKVLKSQYLTTGQEFWDWKNYPPYANQNIYDM